LAPFALCKCLSYVILVGQGIYLKDSDFSLVFFPIDEYVNEENKISTISENPKTEEVIIQSDETSDNKASEDLLFLNDDKQDDSNDNNINDDDNNNHNNNINDNNSNNNNVEIDVLVENKNFDESFRDNNDNDDASDDSDESAFVRRDGSVKISRNFVFPKSIK
jgi:hypothetical protein